jgi:outer membrane protein assembly factor BamD (BamD/ComL family)
MAEIKFTKHHEIKEDRFIEFTTVELPQKIQQYRRHGIIGAISILAVVIAVFAIRTSRENRTQSANELFGKSLVALEQGEISSAITGFQQLAERYSGTAYGNYALYYMGDIYYRMNNYQAAIDQYKRFISAYSGKEFLAAAARKGLGACYQQMGDYTKAVQSYSEVISDYPRDFSIPEVLLKRARCYVKTGKNDLAKKDCTRILQEHRESIYRADVENLLATL